GGAATQGGKCGGDGAAGQADDDREEDADRDGLRGGTRGAFRVVPAYPARDQRHRADAEPDRQRVNERHQRLGDRDRRHGLGAEPRDEEHVHHGKNALHQHLQHHRDGEQHDGVAYVALGVVVAIRSPKENRRVQHSGVEDRSSGNIKQGKDVASKPIALTTEQRKAPERRRKETLDRRVYQRLTAVLAVAADKTREEVAELLGVSLSQLGEWLRIFRNEGLAALCEIHNKGDPGNLTASQIAQLKAQVSTGCFRNSNQIRHWVESTFGVCYSSTGIKDLLKRIGVSYHKVTGFLWKANPDKQHGFVKRVARHKRAAKGPGAPRTRRYYVDACH